MTKLIKKEVILIKPESTYRTDSAPTESTDAVLVENLNWSLEGLRMAERNPVRASLAKLQSLYAGSLFAITFDIEVKGSGTEGVAPELASALRLCGMGETIVAATSAAYSYVSSGHESGTIYLYEDGSLYPVTGVRGTVNGNCETGSYGKLSFTMTGHLGTHSDTALVTPTYSTVVPPTLTGVPITLGGFTPVINSLSFDSGNEVSTPPDIAQENGYGEVTITNRGVTGSLDPQGTLLSEKDFLGELKGGTTQLLSTGVIGSVPGNRYQIDFPRMSFTEMSPGDRDSIRTHEMSFEALETATDDEFTIIFT